MTVSPADVARIISLLDLAASISNEAREAVAALSNPAPVLLDVPYRSQWDDDAGAFKSDCGPACVAMLLEWGGVMVKVDQLAREAGMSPGRPFTNASDLMRAAALHGLALNRVTDQLLVDLERRIREDLKPFIALVNYADFGENRQDTKFNSTHWVVVIGFDAEYVYIHDPDYWSGRRLEGSQHPVARDMFDWAWSDTMPNGASRQALVLA